MSHWVVMASGPSLCAEDVRIVRDWHKAGRGNVCVVNTTFRIAPWADVLYAADGGWWRHYGEEAQEKFSGKKYCWIRTGLKFGAEGVQVKAGLGGLNPNKWLINGGGNSGHQAVNLVRSFGATWIALLGFDMAFTHGQAHWHGNHPKGLGNAGSVESWREHMEQLAIDAKAEGLPIVNCSRRTALKGFERMPIEQALA